MRTLIKNAVIIDGTGRKQFTGNIEIFGDTISNILDKNITATNTHYDIVLDVQYAYITPGFIDLHSHTDLANFSEQTLRSKIMQGITTEVVGQCGFSAAPMPREKQRNWRDISLIDNSVKQWEWETIDGYFSALAHNGMDSNLATFVGHGTLRFIIAGAQNRKLIPRELDKLCGLIDEAFAMGVFGVSLGLFYVPGVFADNDELAVIAQRVAKVGGFIAVHLRSEGDGLISSLFNVCQLVKKYDVHLHISHLKTIGKMNHLKLNDALNIIEQYKLTFDHYPYTAGSTLLTSLLPPWILPDLSSPSTRIQIKNILEGKEKPPLDVQWDNLPQLVGWDNIYFLSSPILQLKEYEKHSIEQIAVNTKQHPVDALLDLIIRSNGKANMLDFHSSDESILVKLKHPLGLIGSDTVIGERMHPRCFGTYPKIISKYVFDEKKISLEEVVSKMTSLPAALLGIKNRGIIKIGNKADLAIFTNDFRDKATYLKEEYAVGLKYLFINGKLKVSNSEFIVDSKPGVVII